jgi:hypothetical protein
MYVREIEPAAGISRPVVFARERRAEAADRGGALRSPSGLPAGPTPEENPERQV